MKRIAFSWWLIVLLVTAVVPFAHRVAAKSEPRLRAFASVDRHQAPAGVRVQAIVQPAHENRSLEIVVDSEWHFRSSTIELDGDEAERVHVVLFRPMPGGTYEVRVVLLGGGGEVLATSNLRVIVFD